MTTNYERIKAMSVDEMANFFTEMKPKGCGLCMGVYMGCLRQVSCTNSIKEWLLSDKPEGRLDSESEVENANRQ